MRRLIGAALVGGALTCLPALLPAQALCGGAVTAPPVGGYAVYDVTLPSGRVIATRFAVVGAENREGTRNIWFELWARRDTLPPAIGQVLVPGFPYDPSAVAAAWLQSFTADEPVELNPRELANTRRSLPPQVRNIVDGCKSASLVGTESVTVPAGTFRAQHYRNALRGSDIWVSSDVPFGIVKMSDAQQRGSMVLTRMGKDGKSSFGGKKQGGGA